jgi:mono/diheme cytochrome c family protein
MTRIAPRLRPAAFAIAALALTQTGGAAGAAAAPDLSAPEYRNTVQPFLAKNCAVCHSDKLKVANLSLEHPVSDPVLWRKVFDKLSTGRMPPPGAPKPDPASVHSVTAWIGKAFPQETASNPGRVTAHRLNRAEYNNTIHDLLGVSIHAADDFPLDDAGYGFDNIGDVLSVSPLLMEKYMAAAKKISRVAIYGEPYVNRPTKLIRYMSRKSQDDPTPGALPYSERGAIYGSFDFPVDGEYEFHMRDANYRPRDAASARHKELSRKRNLTDDEKRELAEENRQAYPPVRMVMTLDGKQILTEVVEGSIDYQYAHGEAIARVKVSAGEHFFRASYPEFADMANPRDNVNLDGRRKLFIDYVDIVGPFNPSGGPSSRTRIFVCSEKTPECAARIVDHLASRAWRRPLVPEERGELINLSAAVRRNGDSFDESIRVALEAMLVSPNFLFRVERQAATAGPSPVSDYDLASRLSYFLWSSMPDDQLLRAADEHRLRQPGVLESEVRRMLADPKADALIDNFVGQWLGLRLLDRRKPDPAHFPTVDDELLDAMRQETMLFSRAIMREDRNVLGFIDGRFTYLNGPLARHYGIQGVKGEAFQRVELTTGERGGVLSQASILTLSSYATRTSPVLRGKWVLDNLLGTPPPPPPPNIPALKEENLGTEASVRERLEQHRANPACAVCHNQMDPIGFGLENYDASGAWREKDGNFPIDSSGKLPGGASFNGPEQLKQILLSQKELFVRNLTEKMLTYALGRGLESYDALAVDRIMKGLASNQYRFSSLVLGIVNSEPFQMRAGNAAGTSAKNNGGTNGAS